MVVPFLIGCLRRTPDTYHLAGIKRGTATSNFHVHRDNLPVGLPTVSTTGMRRSGGLQRQVWRDAFLSRVGGIWRVLAEGVANVMCPCSSPVGLAGRLRLRRRAAPRRAVRARRGPTSGMVRYHQIGRASCRE